MLTCEQLELIHEMGRRGMRQREIAEDLGVTQGRISQVLGGRGVRGPDPRGKRPPSLPSARNLMIRAEYAAGTRIKDLARWHHLTSQRISQIVARPKSESAPG